MLSTIYYIYSIYGQYKVVPKDAYALLNKKIQPIQLRISCKFYYLTELRSGVATASNPKSARDAIPAF
jgi:hypothetical protein